MSTNEALNAQFCVRFEKDSADQIEVSVRL